MDVLAFGYLGSIGGEPPVYDDARVRASKPPPAEMPSGMMGAALARSMVSENKVRSRSSTPSRRKRLTNPV